MESKPLRIVLIVILVMLGVGISFTGGLVAGYTLPHDVSLSLPSFLVPQPTSPAIPTPQGQEQQSTATTSTQDLTTLFQPFWQAWDLVHQEYVNQPVDDEKLMQGAISGMLNSLGDPYTGYLDPFEYQQANAPLIGDYDGIGAWVDTTGDYLTITSTMDGSPAEKAGLKTGDEITAVDGQDMKGQDPNIVLRKVLGPAGTSVTLTILREGQTTPFDVTLVRANIKITLVSGKMLDNNIAYVKVLQFGQNTDQDLRNELKTLLAQNPDGLILDLRDDPGGFLDTAINIISQFIPKGTVMYEEHSDGSRTPYEARAGGLATNIPMVVLVNKGSASASEITAGALQDLGRAPLVGVTTYGKGSVQTWTELSNNEGAVKITIAHWLTPKGTQINGVGLTPDYVVEMTDQDIQNNLDPQLAKAEQVLQNEISQP